MERFRLEAVACSRLRHDNVVFVTDFGFDENVGLYLVMEYLEGFTLKALLHHTDGLPVGRAARIGVQLCKAMSAAHRLSIVHRDLKPENVMILAELSRPDHVKILDFGIATVRTSDEEVGTEQQVIGTPSYMAPEQIVGGKAGTLPCVDIYASGLMLYAMLSGAPPFREGGDQQILQDHLRTRAPLVGESVAELSGSRLEALIASMLEKQPSRRPKSLDHVRDELQAALDELIEEGVEGSIYETLTMESLDAEAEATAIWNTDLSGTIRMTAVIRQIRAVSPDSSAAVLLDAIPTLETVRGEAVCLALWGILQQELLDHDADSLEFGAASDQLVLLLRAVLESHDGRELRPSQRKVFRAVKNTLPLLDRERIDALTRAMRPLVADPLFPDELAPAEHQGSWESFKAVMTTEIHLPWRRTGKRTPLDDLSLIQKLKQDVSLASIGAVLTHELRLFEEEQESEGED